MFNLFKKGKRIDSVSKLERSETQNPVTQEDVMAFIYDKKMVPNEYGENKVIISRWVKCDGDIVKKGELLLELEIRRKFDTSMHATVSALFDGLLEIIKEESDFIYPDYLIEGEKVFKIYKEPFEQKQQELKNKRFQNIPLIKIDKFSGSKEIRWEMVGGKPKNKRARTYDGFIFEDENNHIKLIFTLNNIDNKDFIIFRYLTREYKLTVGSKILFYFSDGEIHTFEILTKPYLHSDDSNWGHIFETRVQITIDELECLKTKEFMDWQIEFPQPGKKITGVVPSSDIQFSINKLAIEYCELVGTELNNYQPLQNKGDLVSKTSKSDEECYVYLMVDSTNNYHKIGTSIKPLIREKTLLSEKPTIELLCSKRFPSRRIALSFEFALHQAYKEKRVRGEWFDLSNKDIQELKESFE